MKKVGLMMKFLLFSFILGLMISSAALADLYWESDQETKGIQGRPDETKVIKTYLTSYASRTEREGQITIMNFDTKIVSYQSANQDLSADQYGGNGKAA